MAKTFTQSVAISKDLLDETVKATVRITVKSDDEASAVSVKDSLATAVKDALQIASA